MGYFSLGGGFDLVEDIFDGVSGKTAADAAKEAAGIQADAAIAQAQATKESTAMQVEEQRLAREQARGDLQPFTDYGAGFMDMAKGAVDNTQALFNDPTSIMANPMFMALQEDTRRQNLQNAAVGGRLGTGGALEGLEQSALRTGFDILNSERNAQIQNATLLSNLVGGGQNAAAGQGSASMTAGGNIGNFMSTGNRLEGEQMIGGANAEASGVVGAANAKTQGMMNILNLGATIYGGGA